MKEFSPNFPDDINNYSGLFVLGEAPGAKEEEEGKPFVGLSGKLLMKELENKGFKRNNVYITNVFWIRPKNNDVTLFFTNNEKRGSKKYPKYRNMFLKKEYENNLERLYLEIDLISPKAILLVGAIPLWALTGVSKVSEYRGTIFKYNNCYVVSSFHPAYILRNRNKILEFRSDLSLVEKILLEQKNA